MDAQRGKSVPQQTDARSHISQSVAHSRVGSVGARVDLAMKIQPARLQTVGTPTKSSARANLSRTQPQFSRVSRSVRAGPKTMASLESPDGRKNMDSTFRRTGLSVGVVAGTERNEPFGHSFYRSPVEDTKYRISVGNAVNNQKLKSFVELESKRLGFIPGPKYVQHSDWKNNIPGRTGKFLQKARKTFTDDIMEYEKKTPAPSKYHNADQLKKRSKIRGNYLVKDTRVHFTEHQKWLSQQVPPAKYANTNVKWTKPKIFGPHIGKPDTAKGASNWVIPKMDGPGPGSYDAPEAMRQAQWGKVKGQSKQTEFPPSFTEKHKKMFAHVPGSGHYKQLETAQLKVSKDTNFKYKRH